MTVWHSENEPCVVRTANTSHRGHLKGQPGDFVLLLEIFRKETNSHNIKLYALVLIA